MLKKLSARHLDIIRRLLVGQTPGEIALELGMSESRLSVLQADPIFQARYEVEQAKLSERFIEQRMEAMGVLEDTALQAARMARDAAINGKVGEREIKPELQLKSIWDVLDRTGNKAPEKKIVGHLNLADLVAEAYREKHGDEDDEEWVGGNGPDTHQQTGITSVPGQTAHPNAGTDAGAESGPPRLMLPSPPTETPVQLSLFDGNI